MENSRERNTGVRLDVRIFLIMCSISAFTFGGGYVVIPMMRKYYVGGLKLITEQELLDMAAIAQSTPGAIAVNLAVLVGYKIGGMRGAVISCIGTVLPPFLILSVISSFYREFRDNHMISAALKGMEAGVAAIMVDLVVDMVGTVIKEHNRLLSLMVPGAFLASLFLPVNVALIILTCALLSGTQVWMKQRKGGGIRDTDYENPAA